MSEQQQVRPTSEQKPDEEALAKPQVQDEMTEEEDNFFDEISKEIEKKTGIAKSFKQKGGQ